MDTDKSVRALSLLEELSVEGALVPNRRGKLYRLAAAEIVRLQTIIDSRPAINAGLPETYIAWSRGIYASDIAQVVGTH